MTVDGVNDGTYTRVTSVDFATRDELPTIAADCAAHSALFAVMLCCSDRHLDWWL